ncbi:MAG: carbon storage regulator [Bacteroidota bacterium]
MLILTRNIGNSIMLDDDIIIKLIDINIALMQAKIGIQAPLSVDIFREEIYIRKKLGLPDPKDLFPKS